MGPVQVVLGPQLSPRVLVESLKASLKWTTIVVHVKRLPRRRALVTLASEAPSPATELMMGVDTVVVEPVKEESKGELQVIFSAPREVLAERPRAALPQRRCDAVFEQLVAKVDERMEKVKADSDKRWDDAKEIKEALNSVASASQGTVKELDKKMEQAFLVTTNRIAAMEKNVEGLARTTEQKFDKMDASLAEHSKQLASAAESYEIQVKAFGANLMEQIACMSKDAPAKRRASAMTEGQDAPMQPADAAHRGAGKDEEGALVSNVDGGGKAPSGAPSYLQELHLQVIAHFEKKDQEAKVGEDDLLGSNAGES